MRPNRSSPPCRSSAPRYLPTLPQQKTLQNKSLLSVAFLGGFAGYMVSQFPFVFLPTFILALGGGGFLAYLATTRK